MSEPPAEIGPPSLPPPELPPEPEVTADPAARRRNTRLLIAGTAIVIVVAALVTAPFWASGLMQLLSSGEPAKIAAPIRAAEPARTTEPIKTAEPAKNAEPVKNAEPTKPPPSPPAADPAIAALKAQASQTAAEAQQLTQRVAALEAKPPPPPVDLGPVEQQLGALTKTGADLGQRIAALEQAMQARPVVDPKDIALALVLLQIREAVEIGRPFDAEYHALVALGRDHPEIAAAAAPLAGPAESGVASRTVLAERLRQLAPQIATAKPPPNDTLKSQIVAQLRKVVTIRRIDGDNQSPAETAVGTAQRDIAKGDLAAAVEALSGLSGPSLATAEPWLKMAKERLAVETALRQTAAALTAALGNAAAPAKGG